MKGKLVMEVLMVAEGRLMKVKVMEMDVALVELVMEAEVQTEETTEGRSW